MNQINIRKNLYLIGIGHKARHGKDTTASYIKQLVSNRANVYIIPFAKGVKYEVINKERDNPLIIRHKCVTHNHNESNIMDTFNGYIYIICDTKYPFKYRCFNEIEVPKLHKIFEDRNINEYWGMNGNGYDEFKDPEMLQFWGTNYRRNFFSKNYWVDIVQKQFESISHIDSEKDVYFIIPDVRFNNEVDFIESYQNIVNKNYKFKPIFLKVLRYNEDGSLYCDPSRDPKHQSECDLDNRLSDYVIEAQSGDITGLKNKTNIFINKLEKDEIKNGEFIYIKTEK